MPSRGTREAIRVSFYSKLQEGELGLGDEISDATPICQYLVKMPQSNFEQQMACEAHACWSKSTAGTASVVKWDFLKHHLSSHKTRETKNVYLHLVLFWLFITF